MNCQIQWMKELVNVCLQCMQRSIGYFQCMSVPKLMQMTCCTNASAGRTSRSNVAIRTKHAPIHHQRQKKKANSPCPQQLAFCTKHCKIDGFVPSTQSSLLDVHPQNKLRVTDETLTLRMVSKQVLVNMVFILLMLLKGTTGNGSLALVRVHPSLYSTQALRTSQWVQARCWCQDKLARRSFFSQGKPLQEFEA